MTTDLTYTAHGLFTSFLPNTPAGEQAWREIADQNDGNAKVLTIHAEAVAAQLRAAGYTVRKVKAKRGTAAEEDALLAELLA
jgi:hypothetical protein